jgi:peptide/nickel transport system permease protein
VHLAPGEPTDTMTDLNPKASLEAKERLRALYGLDQPLHIQYWQWLGRLSRLDFGTSFSADRRPVLEKTLERMPVTIGLNVLSEIFVFSIALPIGILGRARGPLRQGLDRRVFSSSRCRPSGWRCCR